MEWNFRPTTISIPEQIYGVYRIKVNRALWYASVVYSTSIIMIKPRWILHFPKWWVIIND